MAWSTQLGLVQILGVDTVLRIAQLWILTGFYFAKLTLNLCILDSISIHPVVTQLCFCETLMAMGLTLASVSNSLSLLTLLILRRTQTFQFMRSGRAIA